MTDDTTITYPYRVLDSEGNVVLEGVAKGTRTGAMFWYAELGTLPVGEYIIEPGEFPLVVEP